MKELRLAEKMTQQQMAKKLNIGTSTLSGYEVGRRDPDLATLCRIADCLHVSTDYLLSRSNDQ